MMSKGPAGQSTSRPLTWAASVASKRSATCYRRLRHFGQTPFRMSQPARAKFDAA